MKRAPIYLMLVLIGLAVLGGWSRTYALAPTVNCVYEMADSNAPAADVLFVGTSRTGRGIDPVYVQSRLADRHGVDATVERVALPASYPQQFRPFLQRYIEHRGAPKLVFFQLPYNFRSERHPEIDVPINTPRNLAHASLSELFSIRRDAQLNDYDEPLSRIFHRDYASIPVMLMNRLEMNIYAALKYPAHLMNGLTSECQGETLYRHNHPLRLYGDITDAVTFVPETPERMATRLEEQKETAQYMPFAIKGPMRRFENAQILATLDKLKRANSRIVLFYLPALGESRIPVGVEEDIASVFQNVNFAHPMALYQGPLADQLAVSFADTHHVDNFGALHISRYFADITGNYLP